MICKAMAVQFSFRSQGGGGMDDWLIDIKDLGQQLKIPEKTIRNKLSNGTWPLKPVRIGRALRWRQSLVDRLKRGETLTADSSEEI